MLNEFFSHTIFSGWREVVTKAKSGLTSSLISHYSQWNEIGSSGDYYQAVELGACSKLPSPVTAAGACKRLVLVG